MIIWLHHFKIMKDITVTCVTSNVWRVLRLQIPCDFQFIFLIYTSSFWQARWLTMKTTCLMLPTSSGNHMEEIGIWRCNTRHILLVTHVTVSLYLFYFEVMKPYDQNLYWYIKINHWSYNIVIWLVPIS